VATKVGNNHYIVTWDDNSAIENGYNIYRDGVFVSAVPANTSSFEDIF